MIWQNSNPMGKTKGSCYFHGDPTPSTTIPTIPTIPFAKAGRPICLALEPRFFALQTWSSSYNSLN
jgi:hypothetical protein